MWYVLGFFFFKQKTAYEMRISDWSSDVCSSDLVLVTRLMVSEQAGGPDLDPDVLDAAGLLVVHEGARRLQEPTEHVGDAEMPGLEGDHQMVRIQSVAPRLGGGRKRRQRHQERCGHGEADGESGGADA